VAGAATLNHPSRHEICFLRVRRNDAFTGKLTTQTSLAFEKASIIHLLASVLSSLAASQSRADPEGLKRAYYNARATAGMLTYINENFLHAPSTDLSRDVVHILIGISAAQATEVFWEKLVNEKKAAALVARTANQVANMYAALSDEIREFSGKSVFDRHWATIITAKAKYFASIAQYQRALADDAAGKHGAALVRFKMADSLAQEAQRSANNLHYGFNSASSPTLPHDAGNALFEIVKTHAELCAEAKKSASRDNDLIYHDVLPSEASLPAIDKLPAATPITIQEVYGNSDVSKLIGPDIFSRLIPLAVHESASVYSEEKAKLTRAEVERVEMSEVEVRSALENLGLPGLVNRWRQIADGDSGDNAVEVSSSLVRIAEEVARTGSVDARIRALEADHARFNSEFSELTNLLDTESRECERARASHAGTFTQSPSGAQTAHFRQNISSNLASLQAATAADTQVIALWRDIQRDAEFLASAGRDGLRSVAQDVAAGKNKPAAPVPEGMSLLDLQDEETPKAGLNAAEEDELRKAIKEVSERLDRLSKIRRERDEVLKDLKEKIQNDDVSNLLLLNRRSGNVEPQLFATELEKFRPYRNRLAASAQASKGIVSELEAIIGRVDRLKGVRERQRGAKEGAKRVRDWEKKLEVTGASHAEVVEGLGKGRAFYESLDQVLSDLRREVKAFVQRRDAERTRMISDIDTRSRIASASPPAPSPPPPVPSRGLDSQLAGLSLGAGAAASVSPSTSPYPPPPKPTSPHNPYDMSALSSLPSAFSTAPTTSPSPNQYGAPPRPAATSYPSYGSYPSPPAANTPPATKAYTASPYGLPSPPTAPPASSYTATPTSTAYGAAPAQAAYPQPPQRPSYSQPPPSQYGSQAFPPPPPQRPYQPSASPAAPAPAGYQPSQYPAYPPPQQQQPPAQAPQPTGGYYPPPPTGSYPAYPPPTGYAQQPAPQQPPQQQQQQQPYGAYPQPPQQGYGAYQYR
jgi:hypothetical protein